VPLGQPSALIGAVAQLFREPSWAAQLGSAARVHVLQEFPLSETIGAHQTLFDEVLGEFATQRDQALHRKIIAK
jgi:hypothetical protein